MRALPVDGPFDAGLNLWTSFGYFADDADHDRVLAEFARVAAPGGAVAIETVYGGYDGAPFDGDSFRYVLVARKAE